MRRARSIEDEEDDDVKPHNHTHCNSIGKRICKEIRFMVMALLTITASLLLRTTIAIVVDNKLQKVKPYQKAVLLLLISLILFSINIAMMVIWPS